MLMKTFPIRILILLIVHLSLNPHIGFGQKFPFELASSRLPSSELKSGDGNIEVSNRHGALMLPIPILGPVHLFINAREYEKTFSFDMLTPSITFAETGDAYDITDFPEKLTLSMRGLGLYLTFENSRLLMVRKETVATDRIEINEKDKAFGNQIIYGKKIDSAASWMIGFLHTHGIAADSYIPLMGYEYTSDRIHLNIVFPSFGFIQFKIRERWYITLDETVEADSYRLTEAAPWFNTYFGFLNLTSRLEIGYRSSFGLELGLSYGVTTHRNWTINDAEKNEVGNLNSEDKQITSLQFQWHI